MVKKMNKIRTSIIFNKKNDQNVVQLFLNSKLDSEVEINEELFLEKSPIFLGENDSVECLISNLIFSDNLDGLFDENKKIIHTLEPKNSKPKLCILNYPLKNLNDLDF
jgi:hypothetical protein